MYQYHFIVITVTIIIITVIILELLIVITNASLKTTVHYLSIIFTKYTNESTLVENTQMKADNPVDAPNTVSMLIYIHKE